MELDADASLQWELGKLVHELDMQSNARMRERVAALGLTTAQASALFELTGPMTLTELAGRMACEPSNAIGIIDKLESQNLIERQPHPTDRRAKQLALTSAGGDRRGQLLKVLNAGPFITGLTNAEAQNLRLLLQRALGRD
ncbi:MarR family transcriptional regulator [Microbacterium mangrovi]|uniref:MarR family transcriptional regulator n=1 Tax=Microbacterium mangrovi TaxID=1348253 RepID=A0A0B2AB65_9MICO|nr:MarR family transcriptional regulator [Microbacterium mangrovi]KHK98822.1 MarR family transcriptional regulator [Microbacterium mangrovi]